MLFKYKISLEIEAEFDAPLLGVDATKGKRSYLDRLAKATLAEMIKFNTTSYVNVDRSIEESNLNGKVKGEIMLRSAKMLEEDKKNGN